LCGLSYCLYTIRARYKVRTGFAIVLVWRPKRIRRKDVEMRILAITFKATSKNRILEAKIFK